MPALVRQWASANAFPLLVFSQPEEVEIKLMMVEGLITFGLGGSANSIRQKLLVFLPSGQRNAEAKEVAAGGKEAKA